jgi:phosphodiesterase/alkaline phosphatase D-like protein
VDLSSVYNSGDTYNIVDVQNPTVVVATGKYTGPVSIPMNLTAVAQPIGNSGQSRTHTPSEFGAFIATGGSGTLTVTTPPAANTGGASNITTTGAQLGGSVNPNGLSTAYHFEYGLTTTYGSSTQSASAGSGTGAVSVNATLSGLTSGSLYHYRLVAASSGGTTNGSDQTVTTGTSATSPPTVSTGGASNITTTGAQLGGSVNPNGISTTYHFEYGLTATYGSSTQSAGAGSGTGTVSVNATLSGLITGSVYHYRLVAANSGGTVNGGDRTMTVGTTPPAPPTPLVATSAASNVTTTGAQLGGSVNPNGFTTTYHFEYGLSTTYGSSTQSGSAGSGTVAVSVDATLSGLSSGSVYHYRLVAANSGGTTNGDDSTFATPGIVRTVGTSDTHALAQNYPNPFNPATQIEYKLFVAGDVSLKVYNTLGAEVAALVSGVQSVGKHSVQWDAKGLVSGVYFCLLKSGGMVSTRRMIFMK